ncbi:MAG: phage virion morphogenesis protein [Smithella sp.]
MPEMIIKMDGADTVRAKLEEVSSRISNMSPIMKAIGDRIAEQTKRRFESGGPAPDGRPWTKPKTPNPKRIRTLTVTGHLRDSIRYQLIGNNSVAVGTNKVYAAIHQSGGTIDKTARSELFVRNRSKRGDKKGKFKKGTTAGRGFTFGAHSIKIPARPFLGLSKANSDEIINIINEYLEVKK